MTDPDPPHAPPLALPPAVLHDVRRELHPDSDEFIQDERHRTAQELEPIPKFGKSNSSPGTLRNSHTGLQRRSSETSTQPDAHGLDGCNEAGHQLRRQAPPWYGPAAKIWKRHICVTIDEGAHRDHLALERTFLGYLRTSLALSMTGVIVAQLFRLQHSVNPNTELGFFVLGVPLAATFIGFGMFVLLVGAFRFWRQQNAMIRGKIYAGGWEITAIMAISIIVSVLLFSILVG